MPITPLPAAPSTSDPTNFAARADALVAALPTFVTEMNAAEANVDSKEALAAAAAVNAAASAGAAAITTAAAMFNPATSYTLGQAAISAINYLTYRRTIAGSGATDPASDLTGTWVNAGLPPVTIANVSTNTTMVTGVYYRAIGSCDLTLPALGSVNIGDTFSFRKTGAYTVNILRNGHNIEGAAQDVALDAGVQGATLNLIYTGATAGFEFI